ncbi:hypothetical protein T05_3509 [Trichinella murrelli]|uniref:Uncharacterized protein n=1 Tax=Trichinella murrelli TaxID=144512 RepID=A0A0V0SZ52_9BILA|nr:hypothetical protein T05_3509 [Trichinella murrelli]
MSSARQAVWLTTVLHAAQHYLISDVTNLTVEFYYCC